MSPRFVAYHDAANAASFYAAVCRANALRAMDRAPELAELWSKGGETAEEVAQQMSNEAFRLWVEGGCP